VPQITGGTLPDGPVSEKVSVKHSVAKLTATPAFVATLPPTLENFCHSNFYCYFIYKWPNSGLLVFFGIYLKN
jgi:hypothetical protein